MGSGSNRSITNRQLTCAVACFIFGSTLLSCFVVGTSRQDTWFVVITGALLGIAVSLVYLNLSSNFPGKTIVEINDIVYGKIIGKFISSLYLFFFLSGAYLNTRDVGNFVVGYLMPATPIIAILILFISMCVFAVYKGIRTIVRMSFLLIVIFLTGLSISFVLLLKDMNFSNLTPSFTLPLIKYIQGTHIIALIPFGEIVVFIMILQNVNDQKKIKSSYILGMVIAAIGMLVVSIKDCAILGNTGQMMTLPTFQGDTLISYGNILSRAEVIFSFVFLSVLFFKISVMLYGFSLGIQQLFILKSFKPFLPLFAVIIVCFAVSIYSSITNNLYFGTNIAATYVTFFAVLLPGITLIIAKSKNKILRKQK